MYRRYSKQLRMYIVGLLMVLIFIQLGYLIDDKWLIDKENKNSCSSKAMTTLKTKKIDSLCSLRATKRGYGQKVLSISFFGPVENPKIFSLNNSLTLLQEMINEIQLVYFDDWILRIYHDEKLLEQKTVSHFEHHYNFIDFCNVSTLSLNFIPPKIWRFLPAGDDLVNVMASRDLDSPLTYRERAAMNEWLLSNLTFHSMRDHPQHAAPIMGGMWAFRVENDRNFSHSFRSKILDRSLITQYPLNNDQQFLADHLWSYGKDKTMSHASYFCKTSGWNTYHRPFPTRRLKQNASNDCFVGCTKPCCIDWIFDKYQCPIECRPKEHQDWIYC